MACQRYNIPYFVDQVIHRHSVRAAVPINPWTHSPVSCKQTQYSEADAIAPSLTTIGHS